MTRAFEQTNVMQLSIGRVGELHHGNTFHAHHAGLARVEQVLINSALDP